MHTVNNMFFSDSEMFSGDQNAFLIWKFQNFCSIPNDGSGMCHFFFLVMTFV